MNVESILKLFRKYGKACLAFSGGMDSLTLAVLLKMSKVDFEAVTVKTEVISRKNVLTAVNLAKTLNIPHKVLEFKVDRRVLKNDSMRCYYCKKQMMKKIFECCKFENVLDGTNFDDLETHRPGLKAIKELGVKSPLAELKLRKKDVRFIAKSVGLPYIPSDSCLATRIEGEITIEKLKIVEKAETVLMEFLEERDYRFERLRVYLRDKRLLIELKPFNYEIIEKCTSLLNREFSKNFSIHCIV